VTHISPFDARCLLRDRPARPAMPLTTATLNCTVESANSAAFLVEPTPSTGRPLLASRSAASPSSAPSLDQLITTAIARPSAHSRRLTLARFPLLRKGSRELTRSPSFKLAPQTAVHSPFLALGAPRASSSIARGPESLPTREPVNDDSETDVIAVEHTRAADPSRVEKPDKMHQTSSRLLRMTDDERPFTRVGSPTTVPALPDLPLGDHSIYSCILDLRLSDQLVSNCKWIYALLLELVFPTWDRSRLPKTKSHAGLDLRDLLMLTWLPPVNVFS
jgi:hypothetical protein